MAGDAFLLVSPHPCLSPVKYNQLPILFLLSGKSHLLHSVLVNTLRKIPPVCHWPLQDFWDVLIQEN